MDIQISAWGNSLGMRIPKELGKQLGLKKGTRVHAEIKRGKLVISPATALQEFEALSEGMDLEEMVSRMTPENMPSLEDDGPVGKEIW